MINIFQPSLGKEELAAIEKVFESHWIGKGEWVDRFEKGFAQHLQANPDNFLSTTCCTEGIFLAAELFKFKTGDEVIVPSISFIAVGNSVVASGAKPIFCDVDKRSLNATAESIKRKITPKTKAVFLNHYGGVPCEMDPILELCRKHKIFLIEDSACAVKSFYKGKACGTFGDMGLWSFDAMKILCAGDGGLIYLKSEDLVHIAKEQVYYGLPNKQKSGMDSSVSGSRQWWEFEINRPGRRAIMNNIGGAMGVVQLEKLDGFLARRKKIFERYCEELRHCRWLTLPPESGQDRAVSHYFFWVQLEKRDDLAKFLLDRGIYTTFRYWPLHKVKHFGYEGDELSHADYASRYTLNIPLHQSLSDDEVGDVIASIMKFDSKA